MMMDFTNQTVLITGSSRGIGLAIAKAFDAAGAHVILHARSEIKPNIYADFKQKPQILQFDIADSEAAEASLKALYKQDDFAGVDVLVNNAGITKDQLAMAMAPNDFAEVVNVNLNGTFNVTQPIFKKMIRQKHGVIINLSSVVGLMGNMGQINYAASKAGIIGLTKSLAKEGARRGIRVNAIAPGMIVSDMTSVLSEETQAKILENIPLSRFGEANEIAEAALFLAGSTYITGQTLSIDGGLYI
ncbi:3-oxoacyl-[acyl-carrier protein] reductase [Leuconostoc gelidum subsp. gasicomitatum]|nr:3-oxoacyl-[acyl-carrier protein] reductase [Leuconostoc gasicomitatum]